MSNATASSDPISDVTALLCRLPGIGERTAQRLTFHLLRQDPAYPRALAQALLRLSQDVALCTQCHNFTSVQPCPLCRDPKRNTQMLCVVATPQDLAAVDGCHEFDGLFHVLGGLLSPLEGVGPDALRIKELLARVVPPSPVQEVILALRPSVEGESTSVYLQRLLKPHGVAVTVIASGIPMGGELEYADRGTLARALLGRRPA